jgi:hypothetical protein
MKFQSWSKFLAASLMISAISLCAFAQGTGKTGPKYDTTKEVKFQGTVSEVRESPTPTDPIILVVTVADKTTTLVQLAPRDYLKEIDCWVKAGDTVEVTGAKVADASNEVMAREVVFGNNTMVLRDNKGVPIWELWKPAKAGG